LRDQCFALILLTLSSAVCAENNQLSLAAASEIKNDSRYGLASEWATQYGRNTVLGGAVEWLQPQRVNLQLTSRLVFTTGLMSQWYPSAAVQYSVEDKAFSAWLGVGAQRDLFSAMSLFGQTAWQPGSTDFQIQIGLRLNLAYFSQLDARMKFAKPQGATYFSGADKTVSDYSIEISEPVKPSPSKTEPQQSQVIKPVTEIREPMIDAWFLHLGAFQFADSMNTLVEGLQDSGYQQQLLNWYDDSRGVYRLLLGPYNKLQAQTIRQKLTKQGIESFLYKKP
jgi:hypothetical protein